MVDKIKLNKTEKDFYSLVYKKLTTEMVLGE